MVAVFVHGVPESADVWDDLRSHLDDDVHIAVALPGFGSDVPAGFDCSMDGYASWLLAGIEAVAGVHGPVDLVGHDWGGILALRVATLRPDLLRSWISDGAAIFDPQATWHDTARTWQTTGAGEDLMAAIEADGPGALATTWTGYGVPPNRVGRMRLGDPTTDACILRLYRSATRVMHTWGPEVERAGARPGLVVAPTDDPFRDHALTQRTAARAGATVAELEGVGHFWMLQAPERSAELVRSFWQGVSP